MARKNRRVKLEQSDATAPAGQQGVAASPIKKKQKRVRDPSSLPNVWLRILFSLGLVWHIAALFIAPLAVLVPELFISQAEIPIPGGGVMAPAKPVADSEQPKKQGEPPIAIPGAMPAPLLASEEQIPIELTAYGKKPSLGAALKVFTPYLDVLYLNHGYNFFAPDPMPAKLISYEIEKEDGTKIEGTFPDLKTQWPRLLYHRYFMLAEQGFDEIPTRAFAKHLLKKYGGKQIRIWGKEHLFLAPDQILGGADANGDWTFRKFPVLIEPDPNAPKEDKTFAPTNKKTNAANPNGGQRVPEPRPIGNVPDQLPITTAPLNQPQPRATQPNQPQPLFQPPAFGR